MEALVPQIVTMPQLIFIGTVTAEHLPLCGCTRYSYYQNKFIIGVFNKHAFQAIGSVNHN